MPLDLRPLNFYCLGMLCLLQYYHIQISHGNTTMECPKALYAPNRP